MWPREVVKTLGRINYLVIGKILSQGKKAGSKLSTKREDEYIISPNECSNKIFIEVVRNLRYLKI